MSEMLQSKISIDTDGAEKSVKDLIRALDRLTEELKQTRSEIKKTGTQTKETGKQIEKTGKQTKEAGKQTKKTTTEFRNMRHVTYGLQRSFGTLKNQILVAKYALATLGVYAAGRFIKSSVDAAASVEQWGLSFEVMLGSVEEAKQMMEDLQSFELKTTLQLPEIVENTKKLMAMGVEIDNLIPTMKMLGDMSFALGVPLERLAFNFGQVKTQGKLTSRELKDFANAGVPLLSVLAEMLGETESSIRDMISAGEIGYRDVVNAFEEMTGAGGRFANIMERAVDSYRGQVSLFQSSLFKLKASIGKTILPSLTAFIDKLTEMNDELRGSIENSEATRRRFEDLAEDIFNLGEAVMKFRKELAYTALAIAGILGTAAVIRGIQTIVGALALIPSALETGYLRLLYFKDTLAGISSTVLKGASAFAMWAIPTKTMTDAEELGRKVEDIELAIATVSFADFMQGDSPFIAPGWGDASDDLDDLSGSLGEASESYKSFVAEQQKRLRLYEQEQGWILKLQKEYPILAEKLGLVTDAQKGTFASYLAEQKEIINNKSKISRWNQYIIKEERDLAIAMGLITEPIDSMQEYINKQLESYNATQLLNGQQTYFINMVDAGGESLKNFAKRMGVPVEKLQKLRESFRTTSEATEEAAYSFQSYMLEQLKSYELTNLNNISQERFFAIVDQGGEQLDILANKLGVTKEKLIALKDSMDDTAQELSSSARNWGSLASNMLYDAFDGQFQNIEDRWENMLKRMAADLVVSGIFAMFGMPAGIGMFGSGGLFGGALFGAHNGGSFTNIGGNIVKDAGGQGDSSGFIGLAHGGSISNRSGFPIKAASGLDNFVVPSGYPNDSFPVMVQSGETVNVARSGETSRTESLLQQLIQAVNDKPVANTILLDHIDMSKYVESGNIKRGIT